MKKALIWDLDGTLIDSYEVIVPSLRDALLEFGVTLSTADIEKRVIRGSVIEFLADISLQTGISAAAETIVPDV